MRTRDGSAQPAASCRLLTAVRWTGARSVQELWSALTLLDGSGGAGARVIGVSSSLASLAVDSRGFLAKMARAAEADRRGQQQSNAAPVERDARS